MAGTATHSSSTIPNVARVSIAISLAGLDAINPDCISYSSFSLAKDDFGSL